MRGRLRSVSPEVTVSSKGLEVTDSDSDNDEANLRSVPHDRSQTLHPSFNDLAKDDWYLTGQRWGVGPPHPTKYGDPADRELYDWYVEEGHCLPPLNVDNLGRGTSKMHRSIPIDQRLKGAPRSCEEELPEVPAEMTARFLAGPSVCCGQNSIEQAEVFEVVFNGGATGKLHLPSSVEQMWDLSDPQNVKLIRIDEMERAVSFPIFVPSCGRPTEALLNIEFMLEGKAYAQIVVVKPNELVMYRQAFPNLAFFALPEEADKLGIGCARHYIKQLACKIIHPNSGNHSHFAS